MAVTPNGLRKKLFVDEAVAGAGGGVVKTVPSLTVGVLAAAAARFGSSAETTMTVSFAVVVEKVENAADGETGSEESNCSTVTEGFAILLTDYWSTIAVSDSSRG